MLIRLGAAVSVTVQYIYPRNNIYQFYLRVPKHLVDHYGKDFIRKSLRTSDAAEAARKAEAEARKYKAEFEVLSKGSKITPDEVATAGRLLAEKWDMNLDHFIDFVIDPAREKYAAGDEETYYNSCPSEYLTPVEQAAWKVMANPAIFTLSDALRLYLKTHQRGADDAFAKKVSRDWNALVAMLGDIQFDKLSRQNARDFVDRLTEKGNKTGTIRRTLNTLGAITRCTITELELHKTDPFKSIKIQGEGEDKEEGVVATTEQLEDIAKAFLPDTGSAVSMLILLQMELGTRIGEVSGLGIDDVFLDHEIPHVYFRNRPWRSLKTRESERRVPVVGIAHDALKAALTLPRKGKGLFEQYAKLRGNDAASQAANKRLEKWNITTHDFRHTMKDRLREAGCPKDIRDAIQGHASGDVAETYGQGHSLKTMQSWLLRVATKRPT
jgi:integrase